MSAITPPPITPPPITPPTRTTPSASTTSAGSSSRSQSSVPPKDQLTSHRKDKSFAGALERVFVKFWNWIKVTFLFCFFDEEEELSKRQIVELEALADVYTGLGAVSQTQVAIDTVNERFSKLSKGLQDKIKSQILVILKKAYPGKPKYDDLMDQVHKNPFVTGTDKTKPAEQQTVHIFYEAIWAVRTNLKGHPS